MVYLEIATRKTSTVKIAVLREASQSVPIIPLLCSFAPVRLSA